MTLPEFVDRQLADACRSLKFANSKKNVTDVELSAIEEKIFHYGEIRRLINDSTRKEK